MIIIRPRVFFGEVCFSMHGDLGLSNPHGPCIICFATSSKPRGSLLLKGSSAEMIASTSAGLGVFVVFPNHNSICACGMHLFWNSIMCSTTKTNVLLLFLICYCCHQHVFIRVNFNVFLFTFDVMVGLKIVE